jgi:hypothetical protein
MLRHTLGTAAGIGGRGRLLPRIPRVDESGSEGDTGSKTSRHNTLSKSDDLRSGLDAAGRSAPICHRPAVRDGPRSPSNATGTATTRSAQAAEAPHQWRQRQRDQGVTVGPCPMPAISGGEHGFGWPARNRRRDLTQPRPVVVDRQRCPGHDRAWIRSRWWSPRLCWVRLQA